MKPLTVLRILSAYRNLADRFEPCVQRHSDKEAFTFLEASASAEPTILSYRQLREKALAIATTLRAELAHANWIASDRLSLDLANQWQMPHIAPDQLAMLPEDD